MKKKILLKTLIPFATVGIILGAALPLVSCGGSSSNDDEEAAFATRNDLVNYMSSHISNPESADFTKEPYDGTTDNPEMIAWVENHLDTRTILLGLAFSIVEQMSSWEGYTLDICAINFLTFDLAFRCTGSSIITVNENAFKDNEGIKMEQEIIVRDLDGNIDTNDFVPLTLAPIESCSLHTGGKKRISFSEDIFHDGFEGLLFPNNVWTTVVFPSS